MTHQRGRSTGSIRGNVNSRRYRLSKGLRRQLSSSARRSSNESEDLVSVSTMVHANPWLKEDYAIARPIVCTL